MSPDSPTACGLNKTGFRLKWRAKLAPYPAPIRAAGFTLIELSIALVIIGLIVGGVLVGQDLIQSAQIRQTMKQASEYGIAFHTFRLKYNQIAGDMDNATSFWTASDDCNRAGGYTGTAGVCNGNGDGRVQENNFILPHLLSAELVNLTFDDVNYGWGSIDNNTVGFFTGEAYIIESAYDLYDRHLIPNILKGYSMQVYIYEGSKLITDKLHRIDLKFDDGLSTTGSIRLVTGSPGEPNACTDLTGIYINAEAASGGSPECHYYISGDR